MIMIIFLRVVFYSQTTPSSFPSTRYSEDDHAASSWNLRCRSHKFAACFTPCCWGGRARGGRRRGTMRLATLQLPQTCVTSASPFMRRSLLVTGARAPLVARHLPRQLTTRGTHDVTMKVLRSGAWRGDHKPRLEERRRVISGAMRSTCVRSLDRERCARYPRWQHWSQRGTPRVLQVWGQVSCCR